ncbi:MAG: glycosyltransferase family 4 protein, partial [Chloroflexota bacterium]|nr:glycosyltransferase family 4 protein [Chloroflexota bacterium]
MKIGLVIDDHMGRAGGVQEYMRGLRRYLVAQGHTTVIFAGGGGPPEPGVVPLGISIPARGSGSSTSIPLTLETPRRLRALLDHEACDVLHISSPYSPTLSGRLLAQSRAAHVMNFHVSIEPPWYLHSLGLLARTQHRSLRRFHARMAVSRAAEQTAKVLYGGDYVIVPDGIEVERFHPPAGRPRGARSHDEGTTILYVGRLDQRKGVAHLLRAAARLQDRMSGVRLQIGGDGPERE